MAILYYSFKQACFKNDVIRSLYSKPMSSLIDQIAEVRIQEAMSRGEFDKLPGAGKPLPLEDDSAIPQELRAAYRILKNAGFLPPEVQLRKDLRAAEQLLAQVQDPAARSQAWTRLEMLRMQLELNRRQPVNLQLEENYYQELLKRMERDRLGKR
jgi:hypothetical protein